QLDLGAEVEKPPDPYTWHPMGDYGNCDPIFPYYRWFRQSMDVDLPTCMAEDAVGKYPVTSRSSSPSFRCISRSKVKSNWCDSSTTSAPDIGHMIAVSTNELTFLYRMKLSSFYSTTFGNGCERRECYSKTIGKKIYSTRFD
ncbi:8150_t:CDS:2, partial [Funneliformis geosporum]